MNETKRHIYIKGARVHNLKNIEISIPHNSLVVVTGLSGSGKSTLAFDTIFAEGQRRYVESLSSYARQFLGRVSKPDVDIIEGIAPAIAIEQKVNSRNPRSTVGTTTEIYDYLKLLYARVGHTFSPISGQEVKRESVDDITEYIASLPTGDRAIITMPLNLYEGQGVIDRLVALVGDGFQRVFYNGEVSMLEGFIPTADSIADPQSVEVVVDRFKVAEDLEFMSRVRDSVAKALSYSDGVCGVVVNGVEHRFSTRFEADGIAFEEPTEHLFSFNNPLGACPECEGYGKVTGIDEDLVVPDKGRTIYEGAIACWRGEVMGKWLTALVESAYKFDFPIHTPYHELTREQRLLLWSGNKYFEGLNGFFAYLESEKRKIQYRVLKARYTGKTTCPTCGGGRLRREAEYIKVGGASITELVRMTIDRLSQFFDSLTLDEYDTRMSRRVITEITTRLGYMKDVGLGYLTLDRLSSTLSGGESQRINLSTSLGSNLTGSLYILDEPSIGLHPRDTHRLIGVLKQLRDMDNTVIVVEHEQEMIQAADYIVDVGRKAGYLGGEIVYSGKYKGLLKCRNSLTADYLTGRKKIDIPTVHRAPSGEITLHGVRENNLKGGDVSFPLGVMTCVTGVSGSGKSSLVKGILYPALRRQIMERGDRPGDFDSITGDLDRLTSIEMVDQSPIGKSSRSNPVTYIKAYDEIRKLYADLKYSRAMGFSSSYFSFNVAGGRCEECQGEGVIKVGMQFMADVELQCEVCHGKRFRAEVLESRYNGKSISDVLEMTVDAAIEFFSTEPKIVDRLLPLQSVGLGYIKLGQSSSTLSGGEAQRVKLAYYISRESSSEHIMFLFDEPTTGLHFHDIKRLLSAFSALIEQGHTIVVVEHNMDVIKCADHLIDIGAEAGDEGGNIIYTGEPQGVTQIENSYTGAFLAKHI